MWNSFIQWLRSAPLTDAVDRRNAPVMQLLLLFYALLLPANWAWRLASGGEINEARMFIFAMDMLVAALAAVSIALIRHGRFRPAIVLFLALQLISLEVVFFRVGVLSQLIDPAPTMLTLVISGLVLGRRALWIAFGLLMIVFATGFAVDVNQAINTGTPVSVALVNLPAVIISYSIITIILDRSIKALRESLAESNARGRELQREMTERERAQSHLIHAQKMEATGRLASGIAHDFNNVLGVILGYSTERHRLDDPDPDPRRDARAMAEALEGVEVAARRGAAISRKLLSFSRHDATRAETFDAAHAMSELQPMLHRLLGNHVRLQLILAEIPLPIRFDRSQFELVLLSIAANARDAMPDGGDFEIRVGPATTPATGVEIVLTDSGHGMSEAVRQHVFEPFFTTKPSSSGTGLGLAVAYNLIRNAGGEIDVDSAPGRGTTLRVHLPEPEDAPMESHADSGGVRVLLVGDNEDLRALLVDILREGGCDVLAAGNDVEAGRLLATAPPPHVMICDNYTRKAGGSLLQRLRTHLPDVPAILIPATVAGEDTGAPDDNAEFLPRPFQAEQLLQRVRAVTTRIAIERSRG
jgi:signal transduction histidine kinase